MKRFKSLTMSIAAIAIFALAGCDSTTSNEMSDSLVSNTSEVTSETTDNTIKAKVAEAAYAENYTITTVINEGDSTRQYDTYFAKNYYFSEYMNLGYAEATEGIFRVNLYHNKFVSSTLKTNDEGETLKGLWNNELFYSFAGLDLDQFQEESASLHLTDKTSKIQLLKTIGVSITMYASIETFDFSIDEDDNLVFTFNTPDATYTSTLSDVKSTSYTKLTSYLEKNSYYVLNENEQIMTDSFAGFNYIRLAYDPDDIATVAAREYFNPNYYFTMYTDEYLAKDETAFNIGVVALDYGSYEGCYYFGFDENGDAVFYSTTPISTSTDITEVYNYPTYLQMFRNFQFFSYDEVSESYSTDNEILLADFVSNFQLDQQYAGYNFTALNYSYKLTGEGDDLKITFTINFNLEGNQVYQEFEFVDFGKANLAKADEAFGFNV